MNLIVETQSEDLKLLTTELEKSSCNYSIVQPKQAADGFQIFSAIVIPITLTAVQIIFQYILQKKSDQRSIKVYLNEQEIELSADSMKKLQEIAASRSSQ